MVISRVVERKASKKKEFAPERRAYEPIGHAVDLLKCKSKEILACGGVGTGKSRAALEKVHAVLQKHPGARALMVRKTRASMTQSAIVTFEKHVLPFEFARLHSEKQSYKYPNGSELVVGGMEESERIMSSEYDLIYVQEATELKESEWEDLLTRLRNYVVPYQQLIGDCNPKHPNHWIKKRCDNGVTHLIPFTLEDNLLYYDPYKKTYTDIGEDYLATISRTTGARYLRNVKGIWAAEEGMVYEMYDPTIHRVPRFTPPEDWPRIWTFDFGFRNPFVWQEWVLDLEDTRHERGVLYLHREIYRRGLLIQNAAQNIAKIQDVEPSVVVCDHDAQGRAILEDELDISTCAAEKSVLDGIERVQERLYYEKDEETGEFKIEPTIYFMEDALVHKPDQVLKRQNHPTCTEGEFYVYTWDEPANNKKDIVLDKPKKQYDHGMDGMKYGVAQIDLVGLSEGVY
jgi:phage terminase large subunit